MVYDEDEIEEFLSEFEDVLRNLNENIKTKSELYNELANMFTKSYKKWKRIEEEEHKDATNK